MPTVHHLFDSDSKAEQGNLYFLTDSLLFSRLRANVHGWEYLITKPVAGKDGTVTPPHSAGNKTKTRIAISLSALNPRIEESYTWGYMSLQDLKSRVQISFIELIAMLYSLQQDFPLGLTVEPRTWGSIYPDLHSELPSFTSNEAIYDITVTDHQDGLQPMFQITHDNFKDIVANLRTYMKPSPLTHPMDPREILRRSSLMALQLLLDNFQGLRYEVCIN